GVGDGGRRGRFWESPRHKQRCHDASRRSRSVRRWSTGQRRRKESRMGRIVVSENVTLDGVIQDPAGDQGFRLGGGVGPIQDRPAVGKAALDEALGAEGLLVGRRTY